MENYAILAQSATGGLKKYSILNTADVCVIIGFIASLVLDLAGINFSFLACLCNKYGSLREDCNQEDGRCECKPGVSGIKCTDCPVNHELKAEGCVPCMFFYYFSLNVT